MAAPFRIRVAAGVLEDATGRVLVSRRPAGKHAAGAWEFPGGKLQPGESALQALARELDEELGIRLQAAEPLIDYTHRYPDRTVELQVFRVRRYAGRPRGREGQPLRWLAPEALLPAGLLPADEPILRALALSRSADRSPRSP
ncbi:MAG: 8-oxo-dGTP diphosphatase MutT [Gammaproteobacteria bacterium]|nr:MAG: 8-oxo-dGTP diphosphatase MutT [Gammaproteobacteria bacterium]